MDDHEKYYRAKWMSNDQWECAQMFADVCRGFHHVCGTFKEHGNGIAIHTSSGNWATWDYNNLTRLVVMAHDRMIRVDLIRSGPRTHGFALWKRHTRAGGMSERHPTIEDAIIMCRPKAADDTTDSIAALEAKVAAADALADEAAELHKHAIYLRGDTSYREFARAAEVKLRKAIATYRGAGK